MKPAPVKRCSRCEEIPLQILLQSLGISRISILGTFWDECSPNTLIFVRIVHVGSWVELLNRMQKIWSHTKLESILPLLRQKLLTPTGPEKSTEDLDELNPSGELVGNRPF